MNKDNKIYIAIFIIVIAIIAGISLLKSNPINHEEEVIKCIAEKAVLYTQTGCGHCVTQKQILGDYYSLFTDINCATDARKCADAKITGTPTWVINEKNYPGTKSIEELKELTRC